MIVELTMKLRKYQALQKKFLEQPPLSEEQQKENSIYTEQHDLKIRAASSMTRMYYAAQYKPPHKLLTFEEFFSKELGIIINSETKIIIKA
jgi:hypothetical protein